MAVVDHFEGAGVASPHELHEVLVREGVQVLDVRHRQQGHASN